MNINPININTIKTARNSYFGQVNKKQEEPFVLNTKLNSNAEMKNGSLKITTTREGWFDLTMTYIVNSDGSGFYKSHWDNGKELEKGTLCNIYQKAKNISEQNNGSIPEEQAVSLAEELVNTIKINT